MKRQTAVYSGKRGMYAIEFFGEEGSVEARASGPIPLGGVAWTSIVARATGKTAEEAHRLVVAELDKGGF